MKGAGWKELSVLTEMAKEVRLNELAQNAARVQAIRDQITALRSAATPSVGGLADDIWAAQFSGVSERWRIWADREIQRLNSKLANEIVAMEETQGAARTAVGRAMVVAELAAKPTVRR